MDEQQQWEEERYMHCEARRVFLVGIAVVLVVIVIAISILAYILTTI